MPRAGPQPDLPCDFCGYPRAKHTGGAQLDKIKIKGRFCSKDCFDSWLKVNLATIKIREYLKI